MRVNIEKLEAERYRIGESQYVFAERFGMKQTTYSAIINRESTTMKSLTKIADALYLDPRDLLIR